MRRSVIAVAGLFMWLVVAPVATSASDSQGEARSLAQRALVCLQHGEDATDSDAKRKEYDEGLALAHRAVEQRGFGDGSRDASRSFATSFAAAHPDVVAAAGQQTARNEPHAYAAAARAMSDYHWTAELSRVHAPVLILQGLADQLTPPGGSVKMQRALPAARLLMFEDTGHNLPIERPERFTAAVLGFTGGIDASAALAQSAKP